MPIKNKLGCILLADFKSIMRCYDEKYCVSLALELTLASWHFIPCGQHPSVSPPQSLTTRHSPQCPGARSCRLFSLSLCAWQYSCSAMFSRFINVSKVRILSLFSHPYFLLPLPVTFSLPFHSIFPFLPGSHGSVKHTVSPALVSLQLAIFLHQPPKCWN